MSVDHTGWWGCTKPVPASLVSGKLTNGKVAMGGAYVQPVGDDYRGWSGDGRCRVEDGSFAVLAPSSSAIKLKVADTEFSGDSPVLFTNSEGGVTDLGTVDIAAFAQPDAGARVHIAAVLSRAGNCVSVR
jgi:hypothetical protein